MTEAAKLYGGSLYELAVEEGRDEAILAQLDELNALLAENPTWLHLLCQPNIPKKERCALLDEALAQNGVDPYLLNFLKILCERGLLGDLRGCAREYRSRYNEAHGILQVTAVSATALTPEQTERLVQKLEEKTGKKIDLVTRVDPRVLGGIRLDMGGIRLDGTVRRRLETLGDSIRTVVM